MTTTITLPLPPSVNGLYRNVRARGRVKTKSYRNWLVVAGTDLEIQRPTPIDGAVALCIKCKRPDRRKRDISNIIKAVEDLLVIHRVIEDDVHVNRLSAAWSEDINHPCQVTVIGIEGDRYG